MFYSITGKLVLASRGVCVIETGGVAFSLVTSDQTAGALARRGGENVTAYTYLAVREEVYGAEKAAQRPKTLMDLGTLAAKGAVRDVGKVLGMSVAEVAAVTKEIPQELKMTIKKAPIPGPIHAKNVNAKEVKTSKSCSHFCEYQNKVVSLRSKNCKI